MFARKYVSIRTKYLHHTRTYARYVAPVDGAYLHTERICVCFVYREMEQRDGTNGRTDGRTDETMFSSSIFFRIPRILLFCPCIFFSTHTASLLHFSLTLSSVRTCMYAFSHCLVLDGIAQDSLQFTRLRTNTPE